MEQMQQMAAVKAALEGPTRSFFSTRLFKTRGFLLLFSHVMSTILPFGFAMALSWTRCSP